MRFLPPTTFLLGLLHFAASQNSQAADGPIVPFTSDLPPCASNCGVLFDVQAKCSPPNIAAVDKNCFCTDTRLTSIDNPQLGVAKVCTGFGFCTAASDLQAVKSWYDSYCGAANSAVSTATASGTISYYPSSIPSPTTSAGMLGIGHSDVSGLMPSSSTSAASEISTSTSLTSVRTSSSVVSSSRTSSSASNSPTTSNHGSLSGGVNNGFCLIGAVIGFVLL